MSGRMRVFAATVATAVFAAVAALSASGGAGGGAAAWDNTLFGHDATAALSHYREVLSSRPTGIYENGAWLYVQSRVPYDGTAKGRGPARQAAFSSLEKEFLRWMIDRALEKRGASAPIQLSPGAQLVRDRLRRENPAWEFDHISLPDIPTQEIANGPEGSSFVIAWMAKKQEVMDALPADLGAPWNSSQWIASVRDLLRLRGRGTLAEFAASLNAVDVAGVSGNDMKGVFPDFGRDDFASAAAAFVAQNIPVPASGDARDEIRDWAATLARYVADSSAAAAIRDRALALISSPPQENIVFSEPVVQITTNETLEVVTNMLADAAVSTDKTVRTLASGETLHGAVPYMAQVVVERSEQPLFVVTTNRTVVIRETVSSTARRVQVAESGHPQFERLFLAAGTLPNTPSPQTEIGAAAVALVYKGGIPASRKEEALMDALGENPGDKALWNFLGRIYQDRQDWIGAAICFRNALRLDPEFDYALTNLADCHKALGHVQLAVGTAVLAKGLATNEWCEKRATAILEALAESFGGQ